MRLAVAALSGPAAGAYSAPLDTSLDFRVGRGEKGTRRGREEEDRNGEKGKGKRWKGEWKGKGWGGMVWYSRV